MRNLTKQNPHFELPARTGNGSGDGLVASIVSEVKMEVASCFISYSTQPCESDTVPLHRDINEVLVCHSALWPVNALSKTSRQKQRNYGVQNICWRVTGHIVPRGDPVCLSKQVRMRISCDSLWSEAFLKRKFSSLLANSPADSLAPNTCIL